MTTTSAAGAASDPPPNHRFAEVELVLRRLAPRLMDPVLRRRCRISDLVQSTLADAVAALPSFRGDGTTEFIGWTVSILEHNALDRRRRLTANRRHIDREQQCDASTPIEGKPGSGPSPSQTAIDREELKRMAQAMRQLPDDQRRVLHLIALRGRSHAQAAKELGRSEGACRVLLARARSNLLVFMARHAADGNR